jgi:AAA family ATP:ADP antiporter
MTDRLMRLFGDVRSGEGRRVLLLLINIFLLLVAYYIIKTVREPLILATGGAELKSYAAAVQAAVLLLYVPAYGWVAAKLARERLIVAVLVFFLACIQVFVLAGMNGMRGLGFIFYVWVGIFSLTTIAQFWSYANDVYSKAEGDRLFPMIAVGSTAGAPLGAAAAEWLFHSGASPWFMLELASGLLVAHLLLYLAVRGGARQGAKATAPIAGRNGFALVLQSPYLRLIGVLVILLNLVNTIGEYILASLVTAHANELAAGQPAFDVSAYIGEFYGSYFFWVNVVSVTVQAFVVSRFVKLVGIAGVLFALPIVALGAYGLVAFGASMALARVIKTVENATDYSAMNTAKQMLWLPTTREEKYKGKQAVDTFCFRSGDMLAAGLVFAGTHYVALSTEGFAMANLVVVAGSIFVAWLLLKEYRRVAAATASPSEHRERAAELPAPGPDRGQPAGAQADTQAHG